MCGHRYAACKHFLSKFSVTSSHNSLFFALRVGVGLIQGFSDPRSDIDNHPSHLYHHGSGLRADSRHTVYQRFISKDCRSADLEVAPIAPG